MLGSACILRAVFKKIGHCSVFGRYPSNVSYRCSCYVNSKFHSKNRGYTVEIGNELSKEEEHQETLSQMPKRKKVVYAVVHGYQPGLYFSWPECHEQVQGFSGNKYKGFTTENEAIAFLKENGVDWMEGEQENIASRDSGDTTRVSKRSERLHGGKGTNDGSVENVENIPTKRLKKTVVNNGKETSHLDEHQAIGKYGMKMLLPEETFAALRGTRVRVEFDGASKGNPGASGFGAILYDMPSEKQVAQVCYYLGDSNTNNQAEYAGLIVGLQLALKLGYKAVEVKGDSKLIVNQVLGKWKVKNEGLIPYHRLALSLRRQFESFDARQVPREQNTVADELSNIAISEWKDGLPFWSLPDNP